MKTSVQFQRVSMTCGSRIGLQGKDPLVTASRERLLVEEVEGHRSAQLLGSPRVLSSKMIPTVWRAPERMRLGQQASKRERRHGHSAFTIATASRSNTPSVPSESGRSVMRT